MPLDEKVLPPKVRFPDSHEISPAEMLKRLAVSSEISQRSPSANAMVLLDTLHITSSLEPTELIMDPLLSLEPPHADRPMIVNERAEPSNKALLFSILDNPRIY